MRANGSVRRVRWVIVLPEDIHETKPGSSQPVTVTAKRGKNELGRDRQDFVICAVINLPIELLCSVK